MKRILAITALAISALVFGSSSQAAPILWTLDGVRFNDGGTASGSFVYDADNNTYSAIDLSTTQGTIGAASQLQHACSAPECPVPSNAEGLFALSAPFGTDLSRASLLFLVPASPLSNAGGEVQVDGGNAGVCSSFDCDGPPEQMRNTVSGFLIGTAYVAPVQAATPVPALPPLSLALLAAMLAALAWWRQRRA